MARRSLIIPLKEFLEWKLNDKNSCAEIMTKYNIVGRFDYCHHRCPLAKVCAPIDDMDVCTRERFEQKIKEMLAEIEKLEWLEGL